MEKGRLTGIYTDCEPSNISVEILNYSKHGGMSEDDYEYALCNLSKDILHGDLYQCWPE